MAFECFLLKEMAKSMKRKYNILRHCHQEKEDHHLLMLTSPLGRITLDAKRIEAGFTSHLVVS
jgi:hypothetical protein